MSDVIKLLPESVANQIAAGEVIQRPASVVKELLENSIDAQATSISLIIKNSGKTLIQVVDDGIGMSETDARMSFERHATSKLKVAKDLFALNTMGFRGEALASIASIAEVEMKTRKHDVDVASLIRIKSSALEEQSYCQAEPGTSIAVKNLFFSVPARRKFLKSDSVELKYIMDEFTRVALAHPEIKFRLVHNDNEVYKLTSGTIKKRILSLFRKTYEDKLLRVEEDTDIVKINGFVGKAEIAKKQKGDQYIFVNGRFIKSNYLNHAIKNAYSFLLKDDSHPFYVLFLEIDPARIDINVHPTKQEIKFEDIRVIYNYLSVSVKHALGRYSLAPQLDFENESSGFAQSNFKSQSNDLNSRPSSSGKQHLSRSAPVMRNWQSLYNTKEVLDLNFDSEQEENTVPSSASGDLLLSENESSEVCKNPQQLHNKYILVQIKNGFIIIDQFLAHQRILYERYLEQFKAEEVSTQKQLFPVSVRMSKDKLEILKEIQDDVKQIGFEIQDFGGDTFIVNGIPAGLEDQNIESVVEALVENYIDQLSLDLDRHERLARSMAISTAVKRGKELDHKEMQVLIDELFACQMPYISPSGKKCFINYDLSDLEKEFS